MTDFYFDQARNILVYPAVSDYWREQLIRAMPEARTFNGAGLAVPRTLRSSQVLRHFGYPVPPIMDGYDYPAEPGIHPYETQKLAANFMVLHPKCFNLSDMGTGKTLSTLWACDWLMLQAARVNKPFRVLIVCPLSIMQRVWADAIFKHFLSRRTCRILHGIPEKRIRELAEPADFYCVNFDGVGTGAHTRKKMELDGFSKALAERDDIRLVVIDEASAYKDAQTKRHRLARQVFGRRWLWLLTGTPTPNAPTDAYGLAKLVNNAEGKSFKTFQLETMLQVSNFKWKPKTNGYELARKLLTPSIRFDISQVWDGPPMTVQQREVELTAEQKKLMAELKRNLQVTVKSGQPITAVNEAAVRTKFLQVSLGAVYDQGHKAHPVDATHRIEELKAVIREAPSKLLVMVGLTSVLNLVYKSLDEWSREMVNGETSPKERARIFAAFQTEANPRILVADPGCLAHGLDLFAARSIVWYMPTDKTEVYLQANKRCHRPGQKFPTTVVQIVSNPLEREIYARLERNESLQGLLLSLVERGEL